MFRDGRAPVLMTGSKVFAAGVQTVSSLNSRLVNNLDLSLFAGTRAPQSIDRLVLTSASFSRMTEPKPFVNNIDLMELYASAISLSAPGNIVGGKNFISELRISSNLSAEALVQGVLVRDLVRKSSDQVVVGEKTFASLQAESQLRVLKDISTGLIDSQNLTQMNFMRLTTNTNQVLKKMPVTILSSSVTSLTATTANGMQVAAFFPKIMTRSRDQIVTGKLNFATSAECSSNVETVRGVNNNIQLNRLDTAAVKLHGITNIYEPLTFESDLSVILGTSVYDGLMNSMNLNLFMSDLLYKKGKSDQIVEGSSSLLSGFSVDRDIETSRVNGRHIPTQALLRFSDQSISGTLIFANGLTGSKNMRTNNSINGMNLAKFDRSIMQTNRPSVLVGDVILTSDAHVRSDIRIGGRVSGVKLSFLARNTLYKFDDQFISAAKTAAAGVDVTANLNMITLNNVSFAESVRDIISRFRRSSVQITSHKTFARPCKTLSHLLALATTTNVNGWVNGINLDHLLQTAVWMNRPSVIIGVKTFTSDATIQRAGVRIAGNLNRVSMINDVLFRFGHPSGKPQILTGVKTLYDVKSLADIHVSGLVNNMSLHATAADSLHLNGDQRITGKKLLTGKLVLSEAGIGSMNSMANVAQDLALIRTDAVFSGDVTLVNPLKVHGETAVSGLINSVNLTDIAAYSISKDQPQIITGPVTFDHVVFLNNVTTAGPVTGVQLNTFAKDVTFFQQASGDDEQRHERGDEDSARERIRRV